MSSAASYFDFVDIPFSAPQEVAKVTPLIGPATLRDVMHTSPVQIIDIRNKTALFARYSYTAGHIPGAVNVPYGTWRAVWTDPLNVPQDRDLTNAVRAAGLTKSRPVVIVHSSAAKGNFGSAAWVYWVLKSSGFTNLAILDGGMRGWRDFGGEVSTDPVTITPSFETVALDPSWLATHEDVDAVLAGTSEAQLLDARPLHQIRKDASLDGSFVLNAEELVTGQNGQAGNELDIFIRLKQSTLNWEFEEVITYCNNGALAAVDWFMASEVAGIPNVRVYGHSLKARQRAGNLN